ncbi:MAG: tetratricopeptide repeat protein [Bacteroidota bacterium]|nr:tetratricopeptide repeat protein [Bacteroidota bacterium]
MAQKTNNFERFWKELKRRKVVHVVTVYAAVAFIILQLVDIIEQPLRLPDWTTALVIVLLCIGFVIAIFLSWVYDITPTGVRKTRPLTTAKHSDQTAKPASNGWKIATYVSAVIILALIGFNFISKRKFNAGISKLEKSIAVLPFINDSGSDSTTYFINGLMEEILNNLQKIKEFRVLSRTSTEQYKGFSVPTVPEIAKKLGVNYIVEGSGQKFGNFYRLRVQLIAARKEKHLWAESYQKEIRGTQDIFDTQSDIAQSIVSALKTSITPDEKRLIEKKTTTNLLAYDFYLRGNDYLSKMEFLHAIDMYSKAIEEDSLFTAVYAKRAIAHSFFFWLRGEGWQGHDLKAKQDIDKGLRINPELPEIRFAEAVCYYHKNRNYDKALKILNELKAEVPHMADLYAYTSYILRRQGKLEESINELKQAIKLDPFNASYYDNLTDTYDLLHKYDDEIECCRQGLSLIPDYKAFNSYIYRAYLKKKGDQIEALKRSGLKEQDMLWDVYYFSREYDKLIDFIKKDTILVASYQLWYEPKTYRLALIYYLNNNASFCKIYADSAVFHLKKLLMETPDDERIYATLGKCYALIGNVKDAISCGMKALNIMPIKADAYLGPGLEQDLMEIYILTNNYNLALDKMEYLLSIPSWLGIGYLNNNPLYDKLRSLPRFQKIISAGYK